MSTLCRNTEDGRECGQQAVACIAIKDGDAIRLLPDTIDICLSHLLRVMVGHGVSPQTAVNVITTVSHRLALQILADEERTKTDSESHHPSNH